MTEQIRQVVWPQVNIITIWTPERQIRFLKRHANHMRRNVGGLSCHPQAEYICHHDWPAVQTLCVYSCKRLDRSEKQMNAGWNEIERAKCREAAHIKNASVGEGDSARNRCASIDCPEHEFMMTRPRVHWL
jgi:hypothetical protein